MSVLLIASLVLSACTTQKPIVAPPQPATATTIPPSPTPAVNLDMVYNTLWVLVAYGDAANPTVVAEGTRITANFSPDGSLTGNSGCNSYSGTYQATPDGQLTISSPLASTSMACDKGMEQESAYLAALQSANSLSINAQGRLVIGYGTESATQQQLIYTVGQVPFTGTQWVLVSYGDPTAPQKVLPGSVVTAFFSTDGSVSGSAGCNQYMAGYTSNQDQITISAPVTLRMTCPSGMEQEQAYLTALSGAQSFQVVGQGLQITYKDGQGVLTYTSASLPLEKTLWNLISFNGATLPGLPKDVQITALFEPGNQVGIGKVGGFAGCNDYNAVYTVDNATLSVTNTVTTRKACADTMQAETDYLAALQAAESYQIIGQTLQITGSSGVLTYAANRAPLEGTLWTLVALGDPNALQQPVAGSNFTALFSRNPSAPSGIVTGTTGCNEYSSTYAANLTEIKINPPASTKKACDEALMQQEQQFFTGLSAATTYVIQGNSLTLPYEDGKQMLIFAGSQPPVVPPIDMTPINGTTWYLFAMNNQSVLPGTLVSAQFTIAADGKSGSMTGLAGCNSYNAVFGEGMGVNSSLSSQRVCTQPAGVMQQEQAYLASLNTANGYVSTGDLLVISTAAGTLSYGPYPPASANDQSYLLVNATWYLTFYNNVIATGGSSLGTIIFAPNGSLNGFTGCNDFTGNYATNINQLSITNLRFGNKPCQSNAAANQQQAMISILQSARSYLIANTVLQIASTNEVLNFSSIKPGLPVPPTYTPTAPIPSATAPIPTATATVPAPTATAPVATATVPLPTATMPAPTASSPAPITEQPAPTVAPVPTATEPAPTEPPPPPTATEPAPTQVPPTAVPPTEPPPTEPVATATVEIPPTLTLPPPTPTVAVPPVAAIQGPTQGYPGEPVTFSAAGSTPGSAPITGYAWNFGDGATTAPSPDSSAIHLYALPGSFQVTVTVSDVSGQTSSASTQIVVNARLDAVIWTLNPVIPGTAITLQFLNGQLAGFAGCNSYNGSYTSTPVSADVYSVTPTSLQTTKLVCPSNVMQQETQYIQALQSVTTATLAGNTLILAYPGGELKFYQLATVMPY